MAKITFEIDEILAFKALTKANTHGLTLQDYLLKLIDNDSTMIDKNDTLCVNTPMLQRLIDQAKALSPGTKFDLNDLDPSWGNLSQGEHKSLGRRFKQAVDPLIAQHMPRRSKNRAVYVRSAQIFRAE